MSHDMWDLVVIGTGGAAMAAGIEARSRGKQVLLIEHGALGGTCLNIGCVPSKNLLAAAGQRHRAARSRFPVATSANGVDLPALMAQKQDLIDRLRQAKYADVADAHGFPISYGHARFVDEQTLDVDGERIVGAAYVVATGAAPHVPDLPGLDDIDWLTSTTAMEQLSLPASLVVLGGGYVGLEQAQLWAHLGVHVTLVGRFAPHAEPEIAQALRGVFVDDGITVIEERGAAVEPAPDGGVLVRTSSGPEVTADRLLVATGRFGSTADLGLQAAGVRTDQRGFVTVDDRQRTSNSRVFAAGDVSGAPQYVYVAAQTGRTAAINALGGYDRVDYTGLPGVTFTTPQIASAGLTEEQALAAGHDCDCRILGGQDIPRALANRDTRGALKVVADAATGKVLGVHAALDGAGDVMLAATYAIKLGMTVDDVADTWAPYLTMSEALRIAAGLFRSDKPTSCCA